MGMLRYERQGRIAPLPGATVAAPGGADAYGAGLGQAAEDAGKAALKVAWDLEDARVLEALNSFQADIDKLHLDPEKGFYNTRKGGKAVGFVDEALRFMQTHANKYMGKMNPRQKVSFANMAGRVIDRQNNTNMGWQSQQINAYEVGEANACINNSLNKIKLYYDDPVTFEKELENILQSTDYLMVKEGVGLEAYNAALDKARSTAAISRLGPMITNDPVEAAKWYEQHKEMFLPEQRENVENILRIFGDRKEASKLFEEAVSAGSTEAAREKIRAKYSGDRQQRILENYDGLVNEKKAEEARKEAERIKAQLERYEAFRREYHDKGLTVPLERMESENLGDAWKSKLMEINTKIASRIHYENLAKKEDRHWYLRSAEQREESVIKLAGASETARRDALKSISAGIALGEIDESNAKEVLDGYYYDMAITVGERDDYMARAAAFSKTDADFVKKQLDSIEQSASRMGFSSSSKKLNGAAKDHFLEIVSQLNLESPTYRKDVSKTKKEALARSIEDMGHELEDVLMNTLKAFQAKAGESVGQRPRDVDVNNKGVLKGAKNGVSVGSDDGKAGGSAARKPSLSDIYREVCDERFG